MMFENQIINKESVIQDLFNTWDSHCKKTERGRRLRENKKCEQVSIQNVKLRSIRWFIQNLVYKIMSDSTYCMFILGIYF